MVMLTCPEGVCLLHMKSAPAFLKVGPRRSLLTQFHMIRSREDLAAVIRPTCDCACACVRGLSQTFRLTRLEISIAGSTAKFKIYDIFPRCSALLMDSMDPKYHISMVYPTNPWIPWILCSQSGAACASGRIHGLHRSF